MKRIVIILICGLMAVCTQAQIVSTVSSFQKIEKPKKERVPLEFEFYGKVGANIMSADWNSFEFHGDPENIAGKSKLGFDLTFGFMSHFRPSRPSNFYWGAELSLTQVGGGFDEFTAQYNSSYTYPSCSFANWGATLSPTIGWKKEIADDICLDLHFNPGIFSKFSCKNIDYIKEYNNTLHHDYCIDSSYFRASLKGGIGVWYKQMNIDLSYRYLTWFESERCIDYSNIIISLGYKF